MPARRRLSMTAAMRGRSAATCGTRCHRGRLAQPPGQLEAPGVRRAALAVEERAQLEEEARRHDAVVFEDRAHLARARAFGDFDDDDPAAAAVKGLEQRDEEPDR